MVNFALEQSWSQVIGGFRLDQEAKEWNLNSNHEMEVMRTKYWKSEVNFEAYTKLHLSYTVVFLRENFAEIKQTIKAILSVTITAALMTGLTRKRAD